MSPLIRPFAVSAVMLMAFALPVRAQAPVKTEVPAQSCTPTPAFAAHNYPGARNIPTMNDLTRYSGKALSSDGQKVLVQGRVRDARCVPIQGAVVELWQRDSFGNWRLATREDQANPNPVFNGAGRTYTDNNGSFSFITVFPAGARNEAPHLHLRVVAPDMRPLTTALYFADDVRNEKDPTYKRLSATARQQVTLRMSPMRDPNAGLVGETEIILPGKAKYRGY